MSLLLAQAAVNDANIHFDKLYSYRIPAELAGRVFPGSMVLVVVLPCVPATHRPLLLRVMMPNTWERLCMSNPSFIISFSVCMAVCRSYSRSESGNSSYAVNADACYKYQ